MIKAHLKFLLSLSFLFLCGYQLFSINGPFRNEITFSIHQFFTFSEDVDDSSYQSLEYYTLPESSNSQKENSKVGVSPVEYEEEDIESSTYKKYTDNVSCQTLIGYDCSSLILGPGHHKRLIANRHSIYSASCKRHILLEVFRI